MPPTLPRTETIVCYPSRDDCGCEQDLEYHRIVTAALGSHGTVDRKHHLVKFSWAELIGNGAVDDSRGTANPEGWDRWRCWGLSQYAGRLVIMAHGYGADRPFDLGKHANKMSSADAMTATVFRYLRRLRRAAPSMAPTSRIDLVVCLSGSEPDRNSAVLARRRLTIAESFAVGLTEMDAAAAARGEPALLGRPLTVTAPNGYFVYTGSLAVSPHPSGRDKRGVFKRGGKDMLGFLTQKWRVADLDQDQMTTVVAVVK